MNGLVLSAGGARGAYQVGVLKRLGEIPRLKGRPSPFPIVTGASAGAINGAAIAAGSDNFTRSTELLSELWSGLKMGDVFKTDALSLGSLSAKWLRDLTLGGMLGGGTAQSLLDFNPLRAYLAKNLPFEGISRSIERGHLYALGISATNYCSGMAYTFIQGAQGHPLWQKSRRISLAVTLNVDHVWASCAIPIVFQPVRVATPTGDYYFGDGGLRLTTPFSPAIRLGSQRVFAVGIRCQEAAEARTKAELLTTETGEIERRTVMKPPPVAQVIGVVFNAIFLDHLDSDLEHLKRMNEILASIQSVDLAQGKMKEPMRSISPYLVSPSVDLAGVAEAHSSGMPFLLRYLMEGLGHSKAQSADLLSYLLFDRDYLNALIDVGYQDASRQLPEIEAFLMGDV